MIKKAKDTFNIDDWVVVKNKTSRNSPDESSINVTVVKNKYNENKFHINFYFREKILKFLGCGAKDNVIILNHKEHKNKWLLTKSPNGYRINQPGKKNYYYLKCTLSKKDLPPEGKYKTSYIFHDKGKGSGSFLEITVITGDD